ncbi:MAG: TatD family hydrolase [Deltaproteobacteria bacterium]|jgi:TatD DNase family protein|nr:TatD family hydrolase [Deltaproteobacteria bacterium]
MNLIDSHCHLYSLSNVKDAILQARDAGITKAVVVSENLETMEQTLKLRDTFPEFVLPGLGIHPVDVLSMSHNEWEKSLSFLKIHAHEASCIGEIGLDYRYATTEKEKEKQRGALYAQMEVAAENHLSINLHSRRALRQTMEEAISFHKETGFSALLHWFAHSRKLLRRTNEEGIFVSVGPSILFSEEALNIAFAIDPKLILVETDTPVPFNGKPSNPAWVAEVADKLITNHPEKQLTRETLFDNTQRYLKKP